MVCEVEGNLSGGKFGIVVIGLASILFVCSV